MLKTASLLVLIGWLALSTQAAAENSLQRESVRLLEDNLSLWYQRSRPDRMEPMLVQLLRVDPNNPYLIEASFSLALQRNDLDSARRYVEQLQSIAADHPVTARATEALKLESESGAKLGEARLLFLAGQYQQAAQQYQSVFPTPPRQTGLAIDYWQARSLAGESETAVDALQDLHARYPYNGRVEIALYRMHYLNDSLTPEHLAALTQLTTDPVFGREALGLWQRLYSTLPLTDQYFELFTRLTSLHPDSDEIAANYARFQRSYEALQERQSDPAYQRYLRGVAALEAEQNEQAERIFEQAYRELDPFPELYGNLGYATMRQGKHEQAHHWFSEAAYLAPQQQVWMELREIALFWWRLQQVDSALDNADLESARHLLDILASSSEAPLEVQLRQARLQAMLGNSAQAIQLYEQVLASDNDSEAALWGSFQLRLQQHDNQLTPPLNAWIAGLSPAQYARIAGEVDRLRAQALITRGDDVYASGDSAQAVELWQQAQQLTPSDPWLMFRLARELDADGQHQSARALFAPLLTSEATADTHYAYALTLSRQQRYRDAATQLSAINPAQRTDAINELESRVQTELTISRLQNDWRQALRDEPELLQTLAPNEQPRALNAIADQATSSDKWVLPRIQLLTEHAEQNRNENNSEILFAASRIAEATDSTQLAANWSQQALEARLASSQSTIWQYGSGDDWQVSNARSRLERSAQASEYAVDLAWQNQSSSGTAGVTDWQSRTLLIGIDLPTTESGARWQLRIDPTSVSAGEFDSDDSFWRPRVGSGLICVLENCPVNGIQSEAKDSGIALGISRTGSRVTADLGVSPIGFELSTWVGGIEVDGDLASFSWRAGAERRVQSANLLSFAGRRDPYSDRHWGGVTRNGLYTSLSWDQGGLVGWWGVAGAEYYTGHNVASNSRWYAHNGVYLRAYDTEALAVTVGLTNLNWGFQKTLSENTFGHGGYYSPAQYNSLSVPITLFGRRNRLSYSVRLAGGYSTARQHASDFYPNDPDLQQQAWEAVNNGSIEPVFNGGTSSGFNYSLSGQFEYRLTSRWYLGATITAQRSDTFAPNNGMLYLRYQSGGFSLPPRRPPQVPAAYVDY
ncbi:cellulose synthase subunit BcsC-related outer membrane protein [Aliidiomarina soli]|uniref:Cellulose synthase operon C C-terminal domain-containing protein n=1 Tax=Aliidiomarina soli TaxID=1928574 RepID=A0A432WMR3_9GAMM|nr:cellulose synthase subunit BcsC-related outer membrane protein [Aliidiomarina soli]RUO35112.1 hypothetical protein CWE14_03705 [Aliidiomarina soli]